MAELFVVWTDPAYLCITKWLNSQQVHWALFLGRFDFVLTYRLGSKNAKPDMLSCQFSVKPRPRADPSTGLHCRGGDLASRGVHCAALGD